jgi:hypothetical protein
VSNGHERVAHIGGVRALEVWLEQGPGSERPRVQCVRKTQLSVAGGTIAALSLL